MRREMIAVLVLVALAAHVVRSQFDDSIRIAVEYSLDGGVTWTPRGTLQTYGAMRRLAYVPIAGTANANWPSAILTKIAQHALRDKNYLYQLRLRRDGFEPIVKSISTVCYVWWLSFFLTKKILILCCNKFCVTINYCKPTLCSNCLQQLMCSNKSSLHIQQILHITCTNPTCITSSVIW